MLCNEDDSKLKRSNPNVTRCELEECRVAYREGERADLITYSLRTGTNRSPLPRIFMINATIVCLMYLHFINCCCCS